MTRYYFHYRRPDDELIEDYLGSELADIELVEREAHLVASDILQEEVSEGHPMSAPRCLEVDDEHGEIVLYVPFWVSFAVERPRMRATVH